ncbi:MAG: metal ABC transporter ATP-binding protein [Firmicutes bacterium]|nr:metal ABC transporter ATP-binding protein [Bacillota bacterium]
MMEKIVNADKLSVLLGGKRVLEEISFSTLSGQLTGIIGPNGAGKTTLLKAMLGLVKLETGELTVLGVSNSSLKDVRSRIGYMPQLQSFEKRFPLSAADVVATGLLSPKTLLRRQPDSKDRIREALRSVSMESFAQLPFQDLSGGEQQRVLLARSIVRKPELLLLDEPNSGLDFPSQRLFMELLTRLKIEENLAIILVSHDIVSVASFADQLVCINRSMHIHGQPAHVLQSTHLDEAYRCQFDLLSGSAGKGGCDN